MKRTVLRKTSNPKSVEDYLKMFDKYVKFMTLVNDKFDETHKHFKLNKIHEEILKEENAENIHETSSPTRSEFDLFISSQFPIFNDKDIIPDLIKELSNTFIKNDRIESFLKHFRAVKCYEFASAYEGWKRDENVVNVKLIDPIKWFLVEVSPAYDYCKKESQAYLQKTTRTVSETNSNDTLNWSSDPQELIHFIDLYNSDKTKYRPINDYSWTNKSPAKIIFDLSEIEDEIKSTRTKSKKEYEQKLEDAEKSEEYLKIDDKFTWFIIESNSCSFEAYLNDHCGTDSSADVLFSLRSIKDGMLDSHVTISAKIQTINEKKFKVPAVFIVKQVKGKGNNTPNDKYWDAIVKLFLSEEFGYQVQGAYKPENDFHIVDLDKKEETAFRKIKPWWDKPMKAMMHFDLLDEKKYPILKKESWKAVKTSLGDDGEFTIEYDSFLDMLSGLSEQWGYQGRNKENILNEHSKEIDDWHDLDYSYSDIQYEDFLLWIKNIKKDTYWKILESLELLEMSDISELKNIEKKTYVDAWDIVEDKPQGIAYTFLCKVFDAFKRAYETGLEVGYNSALYEAYENHYDDLELKLDGSQIGIINLDKTGKWIVTVYAEAVMTYSEDNDDFGIPDPEGSSFDTGRGFDVYPDFNDEAASERLFEELPE